MFESALGRALGAANRRWTIVDPQPVNPRPLAGVQWDAALRARWPEIRAEWDAFRDAGGRLPRIEDVLGESQGNVGAWSAGLLVSKGRPVGAPAHRFPATISALSAVPGLRSALWSVLSPGAELPEHRGPNAGVLRYHLGVHCGEGSALRVGDRVVPYADGSSVLFDDTAPHEAWNRGTSERVTLFCEILRPLPRPWSGVNHALQAVISLDDRYQRAPSAAAAWDAALNPGLTP